MVACAALVWAFRGVRVEDVSAVVMKLGASGAILVLVPQLASMALETVGWRAALSAHGVRYLPLLRIRVATESPAACLPAGVVLAESLKVPLLIKACGLSLASAVAAIAARKYLLLASQSAYILIAALAGFGALELASRGVLGRQGLGELLVCFGVIVGLAAFCLRLALSHGRLAARVKQKLSRVPLARLRRTTAAHAASFSETDDELRRCFAFAPQNEVMLGLWFIGGWLVEAVETFLILRLIGVELDFFTVASFEVALSLVRNLVFVVPAGVGVQDAGYVLFLRALGVPDAVTTGAAFALIKRSKELFWAAAGFGLLTLEFGSIRLALAPRVERRTAF